MTLTINFEEFSKYSNAIVSYNTEPQTEMVDKEERRDKPNITGSDNRNNSILLKAVLLK